MHAELYEGLQESLGHQFPGEGGFNLTLLVQIIIAKEVW